MTEFQPKTIYLAGRLGEAEDRIADFASELESMGHSVPEKWWELCKLPKPYLDNPHTSAPAAQAMIAAAVECDVMILFPTDDILGAAIEYGAALGSAAGHLDKQVVIVDPESVRQSVFYTHPAVIAVKGLAEVRKMSWFRGDK